MGLGKFLTVMKIRLTSDDTDFRSLNYNWIKYKNGRRNTLLSVSFKSKVNRCGNS